MPSASSDSCEVEGTFLSDAGKHPADNGGGGRARRQKRAPRQAKHGFVSFLLWLVMLACLGLMAIRCLPASYSDGRAVPELVSFVPILLVPVFVCLVLAAL